MTDTLDTQIRMLVTELMDAAPQAPSVADIELLQARRSLDHEPSVVDDIGRRGSRKRGRHFRLAAAVAVVAVIVVVAGLLVLNGGGSPQSGRAGAQTGTWKLMDDQLKGTWQQNTKGGPPPGSLSCPTASTCYAMSGTYHSPSAEVPLLSLALYVSTDLGATWTAFRMPHGFVPTSDLACGAVSDCAAGGTHNGKPALLATTDGGHSFSIDPLPVGVGHLDTLSCTASGFCAGLAADSEALNVTPTHATFLSTNDGGKTFADAPILAGDSMQSLVCSSSLNCTAVGWNDVLGSNDITAGLAARTTDGGQTWTAGALPAGLGVSYLSQLACRGCGELSSQRHHCDFCRQPPSAALPQIDPIGAAAGGDLAHHPLQCAGPSGSCHLPSRIRLSDPARIQDSSGRATGRYLWGTHSKDLFHQRYRFDHRRRTDLDARCVADQRARTDGFRPVLSHKERMLGGRQRGCSPTRRRDTLRSLHGCARDH